MGCATTMFKIFLLSTFVLLLHYCLMVGFSQLSCEIGERRWSQIMLDWSAKQHTCAGAQAKRDHAPAGHFVGGSHMEQW